jgi:hypothetical protein
MKRSLWVGSFRWAISWTITYSKEVPGLLHEFRVEPDVVGAGVAAAPFCFHPLQEIARHLHAQANMGGCVHADVARRQGCVKITP